MAEHQNLILVSIIVPCHNEAGNVTHLWAELQSVLLATQFTFEVLFVDDGSTDDTFLNIKKLPNQPKLRATALRLTRNFGKEAAMTAGLRQAKGAAAIMIDADLQHPPALIPQLLERWQAGNEVVTAIRNQNKQYAGWLKRAGSHLFYKIINAISDIPITPHATDFRLIDRVVIDEFKNFTERNRITRGLIDWLGFPQVFVQFTPTSREQGKASYSLRRLFKLATDSFVSMSLVPLRLTGYFGIFLTLLAGLWGATILVEQYMLSDPLRWNISGSACLATVILFAIGIVLSSLGLISLYIAMMHTELLNRPLYVIRRER